MLRRILLLTLTLLAMLSPMGRALAADASPYCIEVDVANQITTVYRLADGEVVRQMICSTGLNDSTPRGTFRLASRAADRAEWYFIGKYQCYVRYPTRISGPILFHSLPYTDKDPSAIDEEAAALLGSKASHGCVRLRWEDAAWIANNCPDGTEARIFTAAANLEVLRKLLLKRSFSAENGISYERFTRALQGDAPKALYRGDEGPVVAALQRRLGALGHFAGPVTGDYDDATAAAVARFQAANGYSATGVATQALVDIILSPKTNG